MCSQGLSMSREAGGRRGNPVAVIADGFVGSWETATSRGQQGTRG